MANRHCSFEAVRGLQTQGKSNHLRPHARQIFLSSERVKVDQLAGACVAQNGFTEELLFATAVPIVLKLSFSFCLPRGRQAPKLLKYSVDDGDLTFWDQWKSHFHAALQTQRPITSGRMPDFSLLSYHSPLNLLTLSSERCKVDRVAGACGAKWLYSRVVSLRQLSL